MIASFLRPWKLGVKSLLLHPLRSMLTILGIFVGVSSVIWLLAIGEGISVKAQEQIASLGAENIIIRTVKPSAESTGQTSGAPIYGITRADYDRLIETIPTIREAIKIRELRATVAAGRRSLEGRLVGCTAGYADVLGLETAKGHFLTPAEIEGKNPVCVIGDEIARRLFPFDDPIGQTIRADEHYFTVVGVMKPRSPSAGIGGSLAAQEFDRDVYVPIETLWARIGEFVVQSAAGTFSFEIVELSQITLRIDHIDNVNETADLVKQTMERYHRWDDYAVVVPKELLEQARTTKMLFMAFMGLMAAISLIVGGIGIMNIMLATVTERTREIGIRRALGAKRRDIVRQFLIETIVLSAAGGITGILGGLFCRPFIRFVRWTLEQSIPDIMQSLPDTMKSVEPILVPWSIPLALAISLLIGIAFGVYPARRAANMHPVEALRHE